MKPRSRKLPPVPALSTAQKKKLRELALRPDTEIDYSDIPPLTAEFAKSAIRNPFYRPLKKQLTIRVDADVVEWLRKKGKGYQTRINLVLRNAMTQDVFKNERRAK